MDGFWYNFDVYDIGSKVVYIGEKGKTVKRGREYEIEDITNVRGMKALKLYKLKNIEGLYSTSDFVSDTKFAAKRYNL